MCNVTEFRLEIACGRACAVLSEPVSFLVEVCQTQVDKLIISRERLKYAYLAVNTNRQPWKEKVMATVHSEISPLIDKLSLSFILPRPHPEGRGWILSNHGILCQSFWFWPVLPLHHSMCAFPPLIDKLQKGCDSNVRLVISICHQNRMSIPYCI